MRIGLFGGTFDPIHIGHLILAQSLLEVGPLDRIVFIPAGVPPHKDQVVEATAADRLDLVQRAIDPVAAFTVSEIEIEAEGPSYTVDTFSSYVQSAAPGEEYLWILGADSVPNLPSWKSFRQLMDVGPFLVAAREGYSLDQVQDLDLPQELRERMQAGYRSTPVIEVSSRDIRSRVADGRSIHYLVPGVVAERIAEKGIYRR